MMEAETVAETLDTNPIFTGLIAQEDFVALGHCGIFISLN
jgi:hypothetical protein